MQAALAYYDAQKEYALADRNGDGVLEYAQRLLSTPGKQDGLYWAALPGEEESPLGPAYADETPGAGYHGYFFRILKAQGPNAPGGAHVYTIRGRMIAGFALVAWPVKYDDTGVMTPRRPGVREGSRPGDRRGRTGDDAVRSRFELAEGDAVKRALLAAAAATGCGRAPLNVWTRPDSARR